MGLVGFVRFVFRLRRVFVWVVAVFLNFLQKLSFPNLRLHRTAGLQKLSWRSPIAIFCWLSNESRCLTGLTQFLDEAGKETTTYLTFGRYFILKISVLTWAL